MTSRLSVIVGGGSGLGRELAKTLSLRGDAVLLVGRNVDRLELTKTLCSGDQNYIFAADMSRRLEAIAAFDYATKLGPPLYAVFCCAGDPSFAPIGFISDPDIHAAFDGNLIATIYCTQEALRVFRQVGSSGRIVLILSTAAQVAREREPLYTAAKWGARGFFLSVRDALKGDPVQICAVYPGGMQTDFWQRDDHLKPDYTTFMAPSDVAEIIVRNLDITGSATVSEIVINRREK